MALSRDAVNKTTNAIGVIAGVPEILAGIEGIGAGDYVGGISKLLVGVGLLVGFYFIGKGESPT